MSDLLDAYLAEYDALWTEVNTRLRIREGLGSTGLTVLFAMLTAGVLGSGGTSSSGPLTWREVLLVAPLLALALQAMQLRHFVRIATISFYMLVDLAERVEACLEHKPPPESGPLGWIPFLQRGITGGPQRIERWLGLAEFGTFPLVGFIGVAGYLLGPNRTQLLTAWAVGDIILLLLSAAYSFMIRRRFVDAQVVYAFPERLVRSYYEALANDDWLTVRYTLCPEKRNMLSGGLSRKQIKVDSLSQRHDNGKTIITVSGSHILQNSARMKYQATLTLVAATGRWYIADIDEGDATERGI